MADIYLNIRDAKPHLSRILSELGPTGRLVICRRNQPVAELRLLAEAARAASPGAGAGRIYGPPGIF